MRETTADIIARLRTTHRPETRPIMGPALEPQAREAGASYQLAARQGALSTAGPDLADHARRTDEAAAVALATGPQLGAVATPDERRAAALARVEAALRSGR